MELLSLGRGVSSRNSSAFGNSIKLIRGKVSQGLFEAAGPCDFDGVQFGGRAQAKIDSSIARGKIARSRPYRSGLRHSAGCHLENCVKAIPVAPGSDRFERYPVVTAGDLIVK